MKRETYRLLEDYMLSCMKDSAHDQEHVYRVLYLSLDIAQTEPTVDRDVLIAACLLHDIGRREQFEDPRLCHAQVGAEKAAGFLKEHGFAKDFCRQVQECILCHRFRKERPPQSLEGKILFDADKLDVCGAMGIARTLLYKGYVSEPLYSLNPDGSVSDGSQEETPSFFQEYKRKLEGLYSRFYTQRGAELAAQRRQAAVDFYESLYEEAKAAYEGGREHLNQCLEGSA